MIEDAHNLMEFLKADNIITENVNDLIIIINQNKKIEYVNKDPLSTILGYDREELIGKNLNIYIDTHDQKIIDRAFEKDFELEGVIQEIELKKKDGTINLCELKMRRIDDVDATKRFLITLKDVSKQKRFEKDLKASEEKMSSLIDGLTRVGIGVDIISKNYKILFQDSILKQKFGNIDEKFCYEKYMGREQSCDFCPMIKAIENNKLESVELTSIDGRTYEIISAPLPNFEGIIDNAIEVVLDITERKNFDEELKEHARKIEIINQVIMTGNKAENLSSTLKDILNTTLALMNFEGGGIYLVDESRQYAEVVCHEKLPLDFVEEVKKIKIDEGNYKRVFIHRQPILTDNYDKFNPERSKKWGFFSLASIPLIAKDNIVGALNIISKSRYKFSEFEKKMFDSLSREIGTIIARMQAEEKLKESEEKYKQMINDLDVGFYKGVYKGELLIHNPAFNKILGIDPSRSLIGSKAVEVFGEAKELENYYKTLEKEGVVKNLIVHVKKSNGDIATVQINSHLIQNNKNEPLFVEGIFIDMSEQFRLEQELKKSEEKYRLISENANDMIAILSEDYKFEYINEPITKKIMGYSCNDVIGKSVLELIHPDEFRDVTYTLKEGFKTGEGMKELRLKRKKGDYIWVEVKGTTFLDNNGRIKALTISRDITERKKAETKYVSIINTAFDGFWINDLNGKFLDVNDAYCRMIGYTREELLNMSIPDIEAIEKPEETAQRIKKIIEIGSDRFETRHRHKDGKVIDIEVNVNYVDIEGGYLYVFIRDITERKIAELKLKESEEKYRLITENANDLIAVLNEKYEHEFINEQSYLKILGYSNADMLGKTNFDLLHPDDFKQSVNALKQGLIRGEGTIEARLKHKKGHYLWFEFKGRRFTDKEGTIKGLLIARDVSHRKEAEEKLKESEEKFRTIANQSLMGIAILQDDTFKYANQQYEMIFGYSFEELKSWKPVEYSKMIHPEDREMLLEQAKKKQTGEKENVVNRYEFRGIKKTGEIIWIEMFSKTIKYNERLADLMSIIDITDKKIVSQILKDREVQYWNFFNNAQVGLAIIRFSDGRALECNDLYVKLLGYKNREDCLTKFVAPECFLDRNVFKERLSLLKTHGETGNFEAQFKRIDGITFWATLWTHLYPEKGYLEAAVIDITKTKTAEQKLKESETKYRDLIETSSMGLVEFDVIKGEITYINPKLLEIIGYSREELNNKNIFNDVVHPEDFKKIEETQDEKEFEFRIFAKDGKTKWLCGKRLSYHNEQGVIASRRFWLQEVTERKINEKIKEDFLRRISHELKTPLVSIKGFSDLLLLVHKDKLDPYVISVLNEIRQGSNRLEYLINNILETSKLESGHVQLDKTLEDLSLLIGFSVKMFQGLAETREISINSNIHDKLMTKFDKEKIHEVIGNILTNAIKYTPPKGKIEIRSEILKDHYIISIKDSGIGLTEEEKNQLFKQFGKIERYGQGWDIGIGGSGLGLYISKSIVELHGGKIWVESEGRNKGSTFFFSLPIVVD